MTTHDKLRTIATTYQSVDLLAAMWGTLATGTGRDPFTFAAVARNGHPTWIDRVCAALRLSMTDAEIDEVYAYVTIPVPYAIRTKVTPTFQSLEASMADHFGPFVDALSHNCWTCAHKRGEVCGRAGEEAVADWMGDYVARQTAMPVGRETTAPCPGWAAQ